MPNSLLRAVAGCQFGRVKLLLDSGVSINKFGDSGSNALLEALYINDDKKREKMFRYLLHRNAKPSTCDSHLERGLVSWACVLRRPRELRMLADEYLGELDFTEQDMFGMTPLHHAAQTGDAQLVRILLTALGKYHISVDIADKLGLTPFLLAKRLGHHRVAEVLVKEGHACAGQSDVYKFRSAAEWEEIGLTERRIYTKKKILQQLSWIKISGKMPMEKASEKLLARPKNARASVESLPPLASRAMVSFDESVQPSHDAHSLLAETDTGSVPTQFQYSEFHKEKDEIDCKENLTKMMAILADQQSKSYRKSVKDESYRKSVKDEKKEETTEENLSVDRKTVSTLAIVFGKVKTKKKSKNSPAESKIQNKRPDEARKSLAKKSTLKIPDTIRT